jgi:hypothetical protein
LIGLSHLNNHFVNDGLSFSWLNSLIRDSFELVRGIDEAPPDIVDDLKNSDEIANTEAEAHFAIEQLDLL